MLPVLLRRFAAFALVLVTFMTSTRKPAVPMNRTSAGTRWPELDQIVGLRFDWIFA
jgi:hypothetical protein